jgi:polar amino acid transport system substrate-binding protein
MIWFARLVVAAAGFALISSPTAKADALDDVLARGALRWGGDQEGGGPYIYPVDDDAGKLTGFEIELLDLVCERLSARLGKPIASQFVQGDWKNLPAQLTRGDLDVVCNGFELTAAHLATKIATMPYYVYELQLLARQDDGRLTGWDDLKRPRPDGGKWRIGFLGGSAAELFTRKLDGPIAPISFEGPTDAMSKVQDGTDDATLQDLPIAVFYRKSYPGLRFVGAPVGKGYYVMYLRKGDERLRDALNLALIELLQSGKLKALYTRYGMWNKAQEELPDPARLAERLVRVKSALDEGKDPDAPEEESTPLSGWEVVAANWPRLRDAAWMTVFLSVVAMPLAIMGGLSVALGRLYGPAPLRWLLACYVEVIRGTPFLLQLYVIYYVLPSFHLALPPVAAAIVGLAINYSAYEAEIYRAGLRAIPEGQMEAALSLGMSRFAALRYVVVPQAFRLVIPPVTNDFIAMFKDTSICSIITVVELSKQYSILATNYPTGRAEVMLVTAALYLAMSYPMSLLARSLERREDEEDGE